MKPYENKQRSEFLVMGFVRKISEGLLLGVGIGKGEQVLLRKRRELVHLELSMRVELAHLKVRLSPEKVSITHEAQHGVVEALLKIPLKVVSLGLTLDLLVCGVELRRVHMHRAARLGVQLVDRAQGLHHMGLTVPRPIV